MRRSRAEIVSDLEARGLRFRTFSIAHDSPHAVADWDWNQRDLLHIPFVHGGFRLAVAASDEGAASVVYLQRVLGLRLPIGVTFHHPEPGESRRVYLSTLGPLVLVVDADLRPAQDGTLVTTAYSVGAPRVAHLLLPLAESFLRKNYARVAAEDEPLRARRSQLRRWGYRFEDEGGSYVRSTDLSRRNVVPARVAAPVARVAVEPRGHDVLVGRSDHVGLRVVVDDRGHVRVYPRMCMHEGASLDTCEERAGALRCPWHGRAIAPIAVFEPGASGRRICETAHHRLELADGELRIEPRSV